MILFLEKLKERVIELEKDRSNLTVTMTAVVKEKDGHIESLKTNVLSQSTTIDILKAEVDNLKKLISGFKFLNITFYHANILLMVILFRFWFFSRFS